MNTNKIKKIMSISILGILLIGCNRVPHASSISLSDSGLSSSMESIISISDSGSSNSELSSEIEDKDLTGPTISGYKNISVKENEKAYPLEGVQAIDDVDGNVTSSLIATYQVEGDANDGIAFEKEGEYEIVIKCEDSSKNSSEVTIKIQVNKPALDLTGPTISGYKNISVKENEKAYPLEGVQAIDDVDGNVTSSLIATYQVEGDANDGIAFEKEGEYEIVIKCEDSSKNSSEVTIKIQVNKPAPDLSDDITKGDNSTVSIDTSISHDGVQSMKITGKSYTDTTYNSRAYYYLSSDVNGENLTFSFYVRLDGTNIYHNRLNLRIATDDEPEVRKEVQVELDKSPAPTGVSVVPADANGWYKVSVDCSSYTEIAGKSINYILFGFDPVDRDSNKTIVPVIWIDELNIEAK